MNMKKPTAAHGVDYAGLESGQRVMANQLKFTPRPGRVLDGRKENMLILLRELRRSNNLTRSDLATRTGLAVPTVHRLLTALLQSGLVVESPSTLATGRIGRRSSLYYFNRSVLSVAGVDIGNETTRVTIATADGTIVGFRSLLTSQVAEDLPGKIGSTIASIMSSSLSDVGPLVGAGIGIAGTVDSLTGIVTRTSIHQSWVGVPMKMLLEKRLACPVVLEQDDHLSVLAEVSDRGTVPGANPVVEVDYGRGIGAGAMIDGVVIKGVHGRSGRIAHWPSDASPGVTIGDEITPDAMLAAFRAEGGSNLVVDGEGLCELARAEDPLAMKIVSRAGKSLAGVFLRLATMFDPEYMILGGGFAGSFDLFEQEIREALSVLTYPPEIRATSIGSNSVVIGGLLVADQFIEQSIANKVALL
jgi:predicted NBD/HSP70 family sugar kinase